VSTRLNTATCKVIDPLLGVYVCSWVNVKSTNFQHRTCMLGTACQQAISCVYVVNLQMNIASDASW
jgi:hypothetical protein